MTPAFGSATRQVRDTGLGGSSSAGSGSPGAAGTGIEAAALSRPADPAIAPAPAAAGQSRTATENGKGAEPVFDTRSVRVTELPDCSVASSGLGLSWIEGRGAAIPCSATTTDGSTGSSLAIVRDDRKAPGAAGAARTVTRRERAGSSGSGPRSLLTAGSPLEPPPIARRRPPPLP